MALMFFGFENRETQYEEGPLGMPAIKGAIDTNQENAFKYVTAVRFAMETWNVAFHFETSGCLG
jgi:hypothetical protein